MTGVFTVAECYFLPNFSLSLRINEIFIHFRNLERDAKDDLSAYSLAMS